MQNTENYNMNLPESSDFYNVEDYNDNFKIIDSQMKTQETKLEECFQRGNEVKEGLVSKLVAMEVEADTSESFEELFDKMDDISTGVDTSGDTVVADVLLEGYTAHDASQEQIVGTLADKTVIEEYTAATSLDSTNNELQMTIPAVGKYGTGNKLKATFATIASLIGLTAAKIVKGNTILGISGNSNNMDTSGADATEAQVLSGKKVCVDGELLTGIMTNNGAVAGTISSSGGTYTVPAGYHNGSGKVTGPTLAALVGTNVTLASAGNLLTGNTAYGENGTKYTGSMANKAGVTVDASAVSSDDTYTYLSVPANGYYSTGSKIRTENSNLTPTFTTQTRSVTFTADSNGFTTQTVNFSFPNKVLGIRALKCSPYINSLNFPLWDGNYVAIGFGTNSISIPLRGVTSGTSYTITVDAIGY